MSSQIWHGNNPATAVQQQFHGGLCSIQRLGDSYVRGLRRKSSASSTRDIPSSLQARILSPLLGARILSPLLGIRQGYQRNHTQSRAENDVLTVKSTISGPLRRSNARSNGRNLRTASRQTRPQLNPLSLTRCEPHAKKAINVSPGRERAQGFPRV